MDLTLKWGDGETQEVKNVVEFENGWAGDEFVFTAKHPDESVTKYTGRELRVLSGRGVFPNTSDTYHD